MNYSLFILPSAEKDLDHLEKGLYQRCHRSILKLAGNPRPPGSQKLTGEEGYRIRVGDWRILYRIDDHERKVFIYRIKHRKDVYH